MPARTIVLLLLLVAAPVAAAAPHLGPGAIVAAGDADGAVLVLLYVQGGYGDAQSVYVVQPVARCNDPGGAGWYALPSVRTSISAPELEGRPQLDSICPCRLPLPPACADTGTAPPSSERKTGWDLFLDGELHPFGPLTFPPFP